MNTKTYRRDEVIFRQGSYASTMYDVTNGAVGIYADAGNGQARRLAVLRAGETFGEMGLIECYPRSATAVALEDNTTVTEIDADDFSHYFNDRSDKVLSIMRQTSRRLRDTNERYLEACRTVYEVVEAERGNGKHKRKSLSTRLSGMLRSLRHSKTSER